MRPSKDKRSQVIVSVDFTNNKEFKEVKRLLTSALQQVEELIDALKKLHSS
jgi:cobyric acid synthase